MSLVDPEFEEEGAPPKYLVASLNIFWSAKDPGRFHLATSDPRFVDENGISPGIHKIVSSNPASADFDPATFNRLARAFRDAGMAGPEEVEVISRKLSDRGYILQSQESQRQSRYRSCDICFCHVSNIEKHKEAVHS